MWETSDNWEDLLSRPSTRKQHRVTVGEGSGQQTYEDGDIISLKTYGRLFDKPSVGNCNSRQIDLTIFPKGTIPKRAKIQVFCRLCSPDGQNSTNWVPNGVFYISTRKTDRRTGALNIHGYDAMLLAEADYLNDSYSEADFPKHPAVVAADIAARLGTTLDHSRCRFNSILVEYPVGPSGNRTMREVLSLIARQNGGNWTIAGDGSLLLMPLFSAPAPTRWILDDLGKGILMAGDGDLVQVRLNW